MDNKEIIEQVLAFLEATVVEVFQNQNCLVYQSSPVNILSEDCVSIDAVAEELELRMVLSVPRSVLLASHPVKGEVYEDDPKLGDWYMELANRLMGSLKNRLVTNLSSMSLGLPVRVNRESLLAELPESHTLSFEGAGDAFSCMLGVRVTGAIESLEPQEVDSMDGELELF